MPIDPVGLARFRASDPLRLLAPLEWLLASGGDGRLRIDPVTALNGYGCRPFPRPEAFTFASSTASSISDRAFAAVAGVRQAMLREARRIGLDCAVDRQMERMRDELRHVLGLEGSGCEIVFSPSGTDAQLHALFVGRALLGTPLISILAAADETGSGAAFATRGQHFNSLTAHGAAVAKGDPIHGLAEGVSGVTVPMRDDGGGLRPVDVVDGDIVHAVARSVAAGKRVLLFAMDSSKFGLRSPSEDCLRWIADAAGNEVLIAIDACQARLGLERLRWYLDRGFLILITGSKFFTGAPFSGALLIPASLAARFTAIGEAPAGLGAYTGRSDWPEHFASIRAALPRQMNLGTVLRWVSALQEMRDYFAVPQDFRRLALAEFAELVPPLIAAEPCLQPMAWLEEAAGASDDAFASRTIFPFFARRRGALLSHASASVLYRALNDDVAPLLPSTLPPMLRFLAARRCHIGQPVALGTGKRGAVAALRISAGARLVSESWCGELAASRERLRGEFDQVRAIIEKLALLVRYFDLIEPAYAAGPSESFYGVSAA